MTAVEWLEEELKANLKKVILEGDSELMESLFEQAKVMEEQGKVEFAFKAYSEMLSSGKSFVDIVNSMRTFKSE